jgi:hypothetical protein
LYANQSSSEKQILFETHLLSFLQNMNTKQSLLIYVSS